MANNLRQLEADLKTAFGSNLDTATARKLRDRFVSAYPGEWLEFLRAGGGDTAAGRGNFAIRQILAYIKGVYRAESDKENRANTPAPEEIE